MVVLSPLWMYLHHAQRGWFHWSPTRPRSLAYTTPPCSRNSNGLVMVMLRLLTCLWSWVCSRPSHQCYQVNQSLVRAVLPYAWWKQLLTRSMPSWRVAFCDSTQFILSIMFHWVQHLVLDEWMNVHVSVTNNKLVAWYNRLASVYCFKMSVYSFEVTQESKAVWGVFLICLLLCFQIYIYIFGVWTMLSWL